MKNRLGYKLLFIGFWVAMQSVALAEADQEPGSISWGGVETHNALWVVDETTNKPVQWLAKVLMVTGDFIPEHVTTDAARGVGHLHFEKDFGDTNAPSVSEVNTYWDERFLYTVGRVSLPTTQHNCHSYAFDSVADGGHYNYWAQEPANVYYDDFILCADNSDVEANDLLCYGDNHTTIVVSVADEKPFGICWKWGASAVYTYNPEPNTAFDTPMKCGGADTAKEIDEQDWTWTESFVSDGTVYTDD